MTISQTAQQHHNHINSKRDASLTCVQTLKPPIRKRTATAIEEHSQSVSVSPSSSAQFISEADDLLSSYSANNETTNSSPVWNCAWSQDGTILATCHGRPDPCIRLWKFTNQDNDSDYDNDNNDNDGEEMNHCGWTLEATLRDVPESTSMDVDASVSVPESSSRTIRSIEFAPVPHNVRKILAVASFDGSISIWEDFSSESNGKQEYDYNKGNDNGMRTGNYDARVNANANAYRETACGWECTAQLEGHENEVKDITWNATGTLLASCGRDKSVWIWECFLPGTIGGEGNGSTAVAGAGVGVGAGVGAGGEGDFECLAVLQAHTGDVKCIKFAPSHGQFGDGDEILLSASYDDTIKCWAEDAGDWYCALTLSGVHSSTIWSIGMAAGGVRMVSGSADQSLAIWRCYTASEKKDMQKREKEKQIRASKGDGDSNGDGDNKCDHDRDGEDCCGGHDHHQHDNNIEQIADTGTGMHYDGLWKCVGKLTSAHERAIYSVDCAPSRAGHGRIVSGGGDNCINIYREVGGSPDAPLFTIDVSAKMAHEGDVNCVRWHPTDGRVVASAGDDGFVKIWNYNP